MADSTQAKAPPGWLVAIIAASAAVIGLMLWPHAIDIFDSTYPPPKGYTPGKLLFLAGPWSFVAGGLIAWRNTPERRLGRLLVAIGYLLWLGGGLKHLEAPLAWTAGMALEMAPMPVITYALLAFPQERLRHRWYWIAVACVGAHVLTRPVGLVLDGSYDGQNLLSVHEITDLWQVLDHISIVFVIVGLLATAGVLAVRWIQATRPSRRVLWPVLLPGLAFAVSWAVYLSYQLYSHYLAGAGFNPPTRLFTVLVTVFLSSLVVLPVSFLVGLARAQARRARVSDLARTLATDVDAGLQAALRGTLGDDSIELAFPVDDGERWVTADGASLDLPGEDDPTRAVTYLDRRGERVGAVVHDPALRDDGRLLDSVTGIAALAVENERLAAEVQARLGEARASRARIVAAGDEARRRIERDLHDGAQQRLLSAALALRTAQSGFDGAVAAQARTALEDATREIDAGLSELRDLARGIHPTVLTDQGLGPALRALAGRSPLSVEITDVPPTRLPAPVEAAAYYVASEALANAAKHAGAARVRISATLDGPDLVLTVADDGRGGATPSPGGGLMGLSDRVESLDGTLDLSSPPGDGTTLTVRLPVPAHHD